MTVPKELQSKIHVNVNETFLSKKKGPYDCLSSQRNTSLTLLLHDFTGNTASSIGYACLGGLSHYISATVILLRVEYVTLKFLRYENERLYFRKKFMRAEIDISRTKGLIEEGHFCVKVHRSTESSKIYSRVRRGPF